MGTEPTINPPRRTLSLAVAGATLIAAGVSIGVGALLGDARAGGLAAVAFALAGAISLAPVALPNGTSASTFGFATLASSMARIGATLALALVLSMGDPGLSAQALWFGVLIGALALLVAEVSVAIRVLGDADRTYQLGREA